MNIRKHCYLFALEIEPLEVGRKYTELPRHCTLMHRFWSELSATDLSDAVKELFKQTPQLSLTFGQTAEFGPSHHRVKAREIRYSSELRALHERLYHLLNKVSVEYTAPEWVNVGYKPHSTERDNFELTEKQHILCKAIYLIEVRSPDTLNQRIVQNKFFLYARTNRG